MSKIDYAGEFEAFWADPSRWRSHATANVEQLAEQILSVCGGGKLLDVGCGAGHLVQALLRRGVDAYGLDVAKGPIDRLRGIAPERYQVGSALQLPFEDAAFPTVVCAHVLQNLSEPDVAGALRELYRVSSRFVFLSLATTQDDESRWHHSVHGREWWENQCFAAGFRKHPLSQTIWPYEWLENDGDSILIVLEKVPAAALERYPLTALQAERSLHMDMLRETGRRSDAHIARYQWAALYVRPGDVVIDAACGLGYGSAQLAQGTAAGRVIGVDDSEYAVEYARANYGLEAVEFHRTDAANLRFLENSSVDVVVSMETLEHLPNPSAFLAEVRRVLRPSGRLLVSVPNEWVDAAGKDPNPFHLHVYNWRALRRDVEQHFIFEQLFAQTAGGGMKLGDHPRRLRDVPAGMEDRAPAEWWLGVAMKDPIGFDKTSYRETSFADHTSDSDYHITAFARDYDNPWLVKGMVSIGMRSCNAEVVERLARHTLERARPGSADAGAALCVLAYRLLESRHPSHADVGDMVEKIRHYHTLADGSPNAWRWRISNQYVAGLLLAAIGRHDAARAALLECASMDCLKFSPLLATKTVDAFFRSGLIAACQGDTHAARADWQQALREAQRVLSGSWTNIWGSPDQVVAFGLPEATQVLDLATRCSYGLVALDRWRERPGFAWLQAFNNRAKETQYWMGLSAERFGQIARLEQNASERARHIEQLRQSLQAHEAELADLRAGLQNSDHKREEWEAACRREQAALADTRSQLQLAGRLRDEMAEQLRALTAESQRLEATLLAEQDRARREQATQLQQRQEHEQALARFREMQSQVESLQSWNRKVDAAYADRCAQAAELQRRLDEIGRSTGWRMLQTAYKVRFALFPRGSRRERAAKWLMHKQRRMRFFAQQGPRAFLHASGRFLRRVTGLKRTPVGRAAPATALPAGGASAVGGNPLVSVILPVYNQADLLRDSIESVLQQTYPNLELVIVNDGSRDGVERVLDAYIGHPKIRVLSQANQKLPKALSNGFDFARGEFWTWTSADNLMEPQQLERQVRFLQSDPDAAMVYCDYLAIDDHGQPLTDPNFRPQNRRSPQAPDVHLPRDTGALTTVQDNFIGACFMYRGSVGRVLGDYSPILGVEDYDYWMRINTLFQIRHLGSDELLYRYRVHDNTLNARAGEHDIFDRVHRLMYYQQARGSYFQRPWRIYADEPTRAWLSGLKLAGHVIRPITDEDFGSSREEVLVIVRADALPALRTRTLPKERFVAAWFDGMDPLQVFRLGDDVQRQAHVCLTSDAATAERLRLFTRQVFETPNGQGALDLLIACACNDMFARKTLPAEDCARTLPDVYQPAGRRLRVVLQVDSFGTGGLERVVLDILDTLPRERFEPIVVVVNQEGAAAQEAREAGVEVVVLQPEQREAQYVRLLTERRIDLVNAHYSLFGARLVAELKIPFVQTLHNTYVWAGPEQIEAYRKADAHTAAYVCVSALVAWHAEQRLGLPAGKMVVVPNGIDLQKLDQARTTIDRAEQRRRLGYAADDFVVLCTASVTNVKSQLHLVRALAQAAQRTPRLKLALLGAVLDDDYSALVRDEITRHGLADRVVFHGHQADARAYYLAADAFALPSFVEGWSLALAEALYCGLPLIATEVGAAHEILAQTGGRPIEPPFDSMLDYDEYQFFRLTRADHPQFVRRLADALSETAAEPEPPVLTDALRRSIDRRQAYQAYGTLFAWLAFGGSAEGVRPFVWELHGRRDREQHLTSKPLARRRRSSQFRTATLRSDGPPAPQDEIPFVPSEQSVAQVIARVRESRGAVIFPKSIDWSQWLFQRPHHLARYFALRGYVTIYDDSGRFTGFAGFKEIEPNLYLFRGKPELLQRIPHPLLWTFCYNYHMRDDYSAGQQVVYDLIDDFAVHPYDKSLMESNHNRALGEADVVAYVARQLESLLQPRPDRLYLPNGVEDEFFADDDVRMPHDPQMARILKQGKPIAGYYGAMAEWFDYSLLEQTARLREDWNFVLIGPKYDNSFDDQPMLKRANVHWLGPKDYAVLPAYLRAFDVATIPFTINDITLATSPLKLYEYFAGGKPVITSPMPECMAFPEVGIVSGPAEYAAALDKARDRGRDPAFVARLRELARLNSWVQRVQAVERALAAGTIVKTASAAVSSSAKGANNEVNAAAGSAGM